MAIICPTVTAYDEVSYNYQLNNVEMFIERVHLDFMDGQMTPKKSPYLKQAWWPKGLVADIHLMYARPLEYVDTIIDLKPDLLIVHAEASGNFMQLAERMKKAGIKVGVALLAKTNVSEIEPVLNIIDHVLIFSGDLGSFGGHADLSLLTKVQQLKSSRANLEIGWDGGINEHNVKQLAEAGVGVLNVGGAIQRSDNPGLAYARLKAMVEEDKHVS